MRTDPRKANHGADLEARALGEATASAGPWRERGASGHDGEGRTRVVRRRGDWLEPLSHPETERPDEEPAGSDYEAFSTRLFAWLLLTIVGTLLLKVFLPPFGP